MEIRHTLRFLGVLISGKSIMFGDNKSVVDSSMHPHAKIHKRHTMLSVRCVRQVIAHNVLNFFHIDTMVVNPIVGSVEFMLVSAKFLLVHITTADFPDKLERGHRSSPLLMNPSRMDLGASQAQKKCVYSTVWVAGRCPS